MSQDEQDGGTFDETGLARTLGGSSTPLFAGQTEPIRIEHFTLIERVGFGGMGDLYLAHDERLGRKVALKLVRGNRHEGLADDRLLREAQTLARISHPNVVTVFEAGSVDGRVFVAMEFVRGQTLSAWLKGVAALPERQRIREVLRRFVDAGRGLAAVHQAGLAHRDFKPDNVLVGEDGRVRVVDFGLARTAGDEVGQAGVPVIDPDKTGEVLIDDSSAPVGESGRSLPTLTATGAVMGTPRYMAPEQWAGRRGDARSDQFSFCVALFEALWGRRPFDAQNVVGLSRAVINGEIWLPPRRAEIPAALRAAVLRGLASEPSDRFATLDELLDRLDRFVAPRRWRIPVVLGLSFALLVALVIVARPGDLRAPDREWLDRWQREQIAAQHLAALEPRIAALIDERRDAEADDAFATFAGLPEHAGTHALTRGWLNQAERLRVRGAREAELVALANAYVESPGSEQEAALLGLARAFSRARNHQQLAATLDTLDELDPLARTAELTTELGALRVEVAAASCDLAGAEALLSEQGDSQQRRTLGAAIHEFGRFTATEHRAAGAGNDGVPFLDIRQLPGLDFDRDDRSDLLLLRKQDSVVMIAAAEPSLPVLQVVDLPDWGPPDEIFVPQVSASSDSKLLPSWLGLRSDENHALLELVTTGTGARLELLYSWSALPGTYWAISDLDARAGPEVYVGHSGARRLLGLRPEQDGWQSFRPHPSTDATQSVVRGVVVGDVDGDGRDELVVAASEWTAYDVRILRPSLAHPDQLELVARHKLGTLGALALIPDPTGPGMRIVVAVNHSYPSRKVFPSEAPGGAPEGFHQLRWRGDGHAIERVAHLPLRGAYLGVTGDFDGNGHVDYAAGVIMPAPEGQPATLAWLAQTDGSFADLLLRGLWPVGAADLDGDDDDELIVVRDDNLQAGQISGSVGVLGTGDTRPPLAELATIPTRPPPERLDAALERTWQRAEQLAALGLGVQASETLNEIATVADPIPAGQARERAAELAEQSGRLLEAAQLYERAASPAALAHAVELYDRLNAFADAARLAEGTRADELRALAEPRSRRVFEFDEPLDGTWRIAADLAFRRESGGLRVDTLSGGGRQVFARWPVILTGEPITIELELDLLRLEWGASLGVELSPLDSPEAYEEHVFHRNALVGVNASGGGFIHQLAFIGLRGDIMPGSQGFPIDHPSAEPPPERRRYRLGASWVPSRGRMLVSVEGSGVSARDFKTRKSLGPGRYELRLVGSSQAWVRGTFWIDRLTTTGLIDDPDAPPLDLAERVRLALANGEPELALRELDRAGVDEDHPDETNLLRMVVLDELGRWSEVEPAFEHVIDRCASSGHAEGWMNRVLVLQPDRFGPMLRRLCPPRQFQALLWTTFESAIFQHPELEDVFRTLTTQLIDLDTDVRDASEGLLVIRLLHARAHGWRQQGVKTAARADLGQALGMADRLLDLAELDQDPILRAEIRNVLASCHHALAIGLLEQGDEAEAIAELDRALELGATPEILADMIAIQPEFAVLHERREWLDALDRVRAGLDQRR